MIRGEAMASTDWQKALGDLARDVLRVLFVYALLLQTLVPVALAQTAGFDGLSAHSVLCSATSGTSPEKPVKAPVQIVHDCLACCLGNAVAILASPVEWPEPTGFELPSDHLAPQSLHVPARAANPPPQRAPPRLG
jgi:hypothetical protein